MANLSNPSSGIIGSMVVAMMNDINAPSVRDIISRLHISQGDVVLEPCYGPGYGVEEILRYDGTRAIGIDISQPMLEVAQQLNAAAVQSGRAQLHLGEARAMPFLADASVDKVVHMNCCYFWRPLNQTLAEFFRVLKPGGVMLTGTKFDAVAANAPYDAAGAFVTRDLEAYRAALASAGFEEVWSEEIHLASGCTGRNAKSGCHVDPRMDYTATFARKPA